MTDASSEPWKVRSPLGRFILTSQAVSLPLAMFVGELKDVLMAIVIPFYGVMLAGIALFHEVFG